MKNWKNKICAAIVAVCAIILPLTCLSEETAQTITETVEDTEPVTDTAAETETEVPATETVPEPVEPDNVSFTVENDTITLYGEGKMKTYENGTPWAEYAGTVGRLVISDGITSVSADAFVGFRFHTVEIPACVTEIGEHAVGFMLENGEYVPVKEMLIISEHGTAAETYASQNIFDFATPEPETPHGSVGELIWNITTNGILSIDGQGPMPDFQDGSEAPWAEYYVEKDGIVITSVRIGNGVTHIGDFAFAADNSISSVEAADTLTSIGRNAFTGCAPLVNVMLQKVISIGENAFSNLKELDTVTFSSLTELGNGAFSGSSLKSISMPQTVTAIPASCFENCLALSSISCPGVVSVGEKAFYGCISLTSFPFGGSITEIGTYAFSGSGLVSVNFNSSLYVLPEGIFDGCLSLKSVIINDTVAEISHRSLTNCPALVSVTLTQNINRIADYSIGYDCNPQGPDGEYYQKYVEGILTIYAPSPSVARYYAEKNEFAFVSTGNVTSGSGMLNDEIKWSFKTGSGLLSISGSGEMPEFESADEAPWYVFREYVRSVSINGVSSISPHLCENYSSLYSASLSNSITSIGAYAFYGTALESIALPSRIEAVGDSAFENTNLGSVSFPATVKSIGENAYRGTSITSVYVPADVEYIGSNSFGFTASGNVVEGFLIRGADGSLAQNYAVENGIRFRVDGIITVYDEQTGASISIVGSDVGNLAFSFTRIADTLEPNLFVAPGEYVIVCCPVLTADGAEVILDGEAEIRIPMPSNVNPLTVNLYSRNAAGNIEAVASTVENGYFVYTANTLETLIFSNADLTDPYEIDIRCCYNTGELVIDDYFYLATDKARYTVSAPSFDGFIPDRISVSGQINGDNVAVLFIYSAIPVTTEQTPPETEDRNVVRKEFDFLPLIEVLLVLLLIVALVALAVVSFKRQRAKEIMENADKRRPTFADKLGETQVFSDFNDELDIDELFREAENDTVSAAAVAARVEAESEEIAGQPRESENPEQENDGDITEETTTGINAGPLAPEAVSSPVRTINRSAVARFFPVKKGRARRTIGKRK
ncbi:MAG: leucine-rich repeat domain-containing protein [Clostridia bacterium]|nr:leucine-rich repeat domain-containing protein [Clostridia bacterium]